MATRAGTQTQTPRSPVVDKAIQAGGGKPATAQTYQGPAGTTWTEKELSILDMLVATMKIDRDQAELALTEAKAELDEEPITEEATDEARTYLSRFVRRHFMIEAELTRVQDQAAARIKNLKAKLASLEYMCNLPAADYTKQLIAGQKAKSVQFSHGKVGFRTNPRSLEIDPAKGAELIAWCEEGGCKEAVKVEKTVLKTELVKLYDLTGELPPGCVMKDPYDKFYVS